MRGLELTNLAAKKGNPGALARDEFARVIWGDKNPWGLPSGGTPETIKAITAADLARFHQTYFVPNNAVISVSGDVTTDEAVAALEKVLGYVEEGAGPAGEARVVPSSGGAHGRRRRSPDGVPVPGAGRLARPEGEFARALAAARRQQHRGGPVHEPAEPEPARGQGVSATGSARGSGSTGTCRASVPRAASSRRTRPRP